MAVERGAEGVVTVALPLPHLDIEYGSVVQKKLDSFATRVGHAAPLACVRTRHEQMDAPHLEEAERRKALRVLDLAKKPGEARAAN